MARVWQFLYIQCRKLSLASKYLLGKTIEYPQKPLKIHTLKADASATPPRTPVSVNGTSIYLDNQTEGGEILTSPTIPTVHSVSPQILPCFRYDTHVHPQSPGRVPSALTQMTTVAFWLFSVSERVLSTRPLEWPSQFPHELLLTIPTTYRIRSKLTGYAVNIFLGLACASPPRWIIPFVPKANSF